MTEALINHLWQSTLLACAAALLTLAYRKNGANIRFSIWFAASVKFLIPFPLFVLIGNLLRWDRAPTVSATPEVSVMLDQITRPGTLIATNFAATPLANSTTHWHWNIWMFVLAIWSVGFVALICRRVFQWVKLHAVVKASSPLSIEAPIPVRETHTLLEPGIFGIFSPVLLLPANIATHLVPEQLNTIIAHELCHWRRKDNLTAAIHMMVEALFWFHPLVWWLGGRMIVERERACDEAVIQSGNNRQAYAEGILKVCQLYVEPPRCAAGVSGGTLRKRIEEVMTNQILVNLHFAKKFLLSAAGFAAIIGPVAVGLVSSPPAIAQAQESTASSNALPRAPQTNEVEMRHYKSSEWKFELDIPKRWNTFPPVSTNSPAEVIRFLSQEDGTHDLIIFRNPYDANKQSLNAVSEQVQGILTKGGFSNFVTAETTIGSKRVVTLDFDKPTPDGGTWSCREYFVADGTLMYVLGFGTTKRDAMLPLFDRVAKTFVTEKSPS